MEHRRCCDTRSTLQFAQYGLSKSHVYLRAHCGKKYTDNFAITAGLFGKSRYATQRHSMRVAQCLFTYWENVRENMRFLASRNRFRAHKIHRGWEEAYRSWRYPQFMRNARRHLEFIHDLWNLTQRYPPVRRHLLKLKERGKYAARGENLRLRS